MFPVIHPHSDVELVNCDVQFKVLQQKIYYGILHLHYDKGRELASLRTDGPSVLRNNVNVKKIGLMQGLYI